MNHKCFVDSNILIYAVSNELPKAEMTRQVLSNNKIIISTQTLNEFCNVVLRKNILTIEQTSFAVSVFLNDFEIMDTTSDLVINALNIKAKYRYSYWDSVMIACALKSGANTLYSEDMAHGQIIDSQLTIINPFI